MNVETIMYLQLCSCVVHYSFLSWQAILRNIQSITHIWAPSLFYSIDKFIRRFPLGSSSRIQIWLPFPTKNGLVRSTNKSLPVCSLLGPFSVISHYLSVDRSWLPVCSDLEKAYQSTSHPARALQFVFISMLKMAEQNLWVFMKYWIIRSLTVWW